MTGKGHSPDKLTLAMLGPEVTADRFAKGVSEFLSLIKSVAKSVTGRRDGVEWLVDVEPGSLCVVYSPRPLRASPTDIPRVLDTVEAGVVAVEGRSAPPPNFPEEAVRSAGALAGILDGKQLDRIVVRRDGRSHRISLETVAHVDSLQGVQYRDWGTVEGRLQTISERARMLFMVYDDLTDRPTRCYFQDDMLDDVMQGFGHRVSVSGMIRYRGDGEPVSIDAEEFEIFPSEDLLPAAREVRGILRGED